MKFRCSSLGKLMTEPRSKSEGPLSVGAKTYIRELAAQEIFGVEFEISSKQIEKGIEVEGDSIDLLNSVRGLSLVKNVERRSNDFITGECDLFDAEAKRAEIAGELEKLRQQLVHIDGTLRLLGYEDPKSIRPHFKRKNKPLFGPGELMALVGQAEETSGAKWERCASAA